MKAVIQRVSSAKVEINNTLKAAIRQGYLILLGISVKDTREDADWLCQKIAGLRVFSDDDGVMNKSITEVDGNILLISQFTLIASCRKGNRPSYIEAAKPDQAIPLYEYFIQKLETLLLKTISTGTFGADMQVSLTNDGPVTIVMDSHHKE